MDKKIMNDREVAQMLRWNVRTLKRRVAQGVIPSKKIGGRRYYSRIEIEYWLSVVQKGLNQIKKNDDLLIISQCQIELLEEGLKRFKIFLPDLLNIEHHELRKLTNKFQDFMKTLITKYGNDTETRLD